MGDRVQSYDVIYLLCINYEYSDVSCKRVTCKVLLLENVLIAAKVNQREKRECVRKK